MKEFHVIFTVHNGEVKAQKRYFPNFNDVERWLKSIRARYWEIGIPDNELRETLNNLEAE